MRKLMLFAIGFTVAIVLAAYFLSGLLMWILAGVFFIDSVILLCVPKKIIRIIAAVMLGVAVGFAYFQIYDGLILSKAKSYDGESVRLHMTASDYSFDTGYASAVDGTVMLTGTRFSVRLYFQSDQPVKPGDQISCYAKMKYTKDSYHKGDGIYLLAYGENVTISARNDMSIRYFPARLRKHVSNRITEIFPERTAPFAKALLLGDDSQISFSDDIAFQKSGIRHVIAVSGLHVSILFSVLYFFTGRRRIRTVLIGIPLLFLFAAVAGFSASIMRACLMQALVIVAVAANQEYDPPTALAFAALVILILNPMAVTSVSFQLSFGSMIGISLFSQRILDFFKDEKRFGSMKGKTIKARLKRWFSGSVSVSLGAMSVTLPLCALYFGMVSVVSVLTNLVTLWVISFTFCGIIIACLLSMLWTPLGLIAGYIVSVPIYYVLLCSQVLSTIPFGVAYTDSIYTVLWVVLSLCLLILYCLRKKKSPMLLACTLTMLYGLSLFLTWIEPRMDNVRLTVLDVGQGQCVLLQSKDKAYMIDCGGDDGEMTVEAALLALGAQGIHKLDGLILTHYDEDHANGATLLCEVFPVETMYLPLSEEENTICEQLENRKEEKCWIRKRTEISCGTGVLKFFPAKNTEDSNDSSMCILFQGENCDILITGDRDVDGERELLEQADIPQLDVLVAGHHGASTSTGLELLQATRPAIVVFSAGENNIHGHPDPVVLSRLKRFGCLIRRTDTEGTIVIKG